MGTPKIKGNTVDIKMALASCRFDGSMQNCHMGETGLGHGTGVESGSTEEANVTLSKHLAKLSLTFEHISKVHPEKQRACSCIYSDLKGTALDCCRCTRAYPCSGNLQMSGMVKQESKELPKRGKSQKYSSYSMLLGYPEMPLETENNKEAFQKS